MLGQHLTRGALLVCVMSVSVCAHNIQTTAYNAVETASNQWEASLDSISHSLLGMKTRKRLLFEDLDQSTVLCERPFHAVSDTEYLELVLALANVAHRMRSDCSGEWSKLWKLHPGRLLRAELARIMFFQTGSEHPLRGVASEVTRHRCLITEWLRGNWWLVENITKKLYDQAPYIAKQITKREQLLRQVRDAAQQLSSVHASQVVEAYQERASLLQTQTALVHYIPYDYVISHEAALAEKLSQVSLVTIITDRPQLRFQVGSHDVVSTVGFLFVRGKQLVLRYAADDVVRDVSLTSYLQTCAEEKTWNNVLRGIQIVRIKPFHEQGRC